MPKCPNCGCTWNDAKKTARKKSDPLTSIKKDVKRFAFGWNLPSILLIVLAMLFLKLYFFGG